MDGLVHKTDPIRDTARTIRRILNIGRTKFGIEYLRSLVKNIAEVLEVKYVFVGHTLETDPNIIQTDVVWGDGGYRDNFRYELDCTPCRIVLAGDRVCVHERDVGKHFPDDAMITRMGIESYAGAPAISPTGELMGLMVLADDKPMENPEHIAAVADFLSQRATAEYERYNIERRLHQVIAERTAELEANNRSLKKTVAELEISRRKLELKSRTDPLTGTNNREWFTALARSQLRVARRSEYHIALLFIDLDYFKRVNDTYGHVVGDQVLEEAADRIRHTIRETDILGRFGGEEFILLSPYTDVQSATVLAGRILQAISGSPVATETASIRITTSVGISSTEGDCYSLAELVRCADAALYQAKEQGRNRYSVHSR